MLAKTSTITGVVIGVTLFAARAHAQPDPDSEAKPAATATAGADGTDQVTLPSGRLLLAAFVEIGLSSGAAFKPISVSPDLWYGATPELTVGLVHSAVGRSGFVGGVGDSLCLTGTDSGCPDLYRGFGVDARFKVKLGTLAFAADGGVYVGHLTDPTLLSVKLGAVGRWRQGQLAVDFAPNVFVGVTSRDANPDVINLPVTALFAMTPMVTVSGQTGFVLPLQNLGDSYAIPVSVAGHYHVNESLDVSLAFSLPRLIAGGSGGIDVRSLTLGGTYAF